MLINRWYRGFGKCNAIRSIALPDLIVVWNKLCIWEYPLCWSSTVGRSTRMHWIYQNLDIIYCIAIIIVAFPCLLFFLILNCESKCSQNFAKSAISEKQCLNNTLVFLVIFLTVRHLFYGTMSKSPKSILYFISKVTNMNLLK